MRLFTTLILLGCFLTCIYPQDGWVDMTPGTDLPGLLGIFTLDGTDVWAVGEEGTVLHSLDAGVSWTSIEGITDVNVLAVEFINPDTGWIACENNGSESVLMRTVDGGVTWESQSLGVSNETPIADIDFVERPGLDSWRGYCTGGLSYVWRTDDYGDTWTSLNGACGLGSYESCCIVDENTGWFVGYPSTSSEITIAHMTEAGNTFTTQSNPAEQPLKGVSFANAQNGIAVGLVYTIINTTDGGENWVIRENDGYRWEGTFMRETGKAWAVGSDGNILYSEDFGETWTSQESGIDAELWEVYFIDDNNGWIAGGGFGHPGVILHTTTGGLITGHHEYQVMDFSLEPNHPNPFTRSTTIRYRIDKPSHVTLSVCNILGEDVITLVDEYQKTGGYSVEFEPQTDMSGIYYSQLKAGGKMVMTRKMLLLR